MSRELANWLDERKHRRVVGTRINGVWHAKLVTDGPLTACGTGRSLADAIDAALDDLEKRDTRTVAGAHGAACTHEGAR